MKKSRYTAEQIAFALRQAESGTPVPEICRKMGISEQTFYRWKKRFAGMGVADRKKLQRDLKRWCRLAGFRLAPGAGVHAIRRAVATALGEAGVDILSLNIFGRWSTSMLGTGVHYIKNRKDARDLKVLAVHPFVETWKEAISYLQKSVIDPGPQV